MTLSDNVKSHATTLVFRLSPPPSSFVKPMVTCFPPWGFLPPGVREGLSVRVRWARRNNGVQLEPHGQNGGSYPKRMPSKLSRADVFPPKIRTIRTSGLLDPTVSVPELSFYHELWSLELRSIAIG